MTHACMLSRFSHVQLFATPWTAAHQAPLSMGFSRQEYWSGLPCPHQYMTQMNLFTKQKQTHRHREQTWLPRGWEVEEGRTGNLELADINYYT